MAEMSIAYITRRLDPAHAMGVILVIGDHAQRHGSAKTGPAGGFPVHLARRRRKRREVAW